MENKKIYLASSTIILIGLFFLLSASPAQAASCGNSQEVSYLSSYFDSLFSFSKKIIKDFGFQISLAAAPDPDFCGCYEGTLPNTRGDSVACSGTTPTATICWQPAPFDLRSYLPYLTGVQSYVCYYVLTVPGVGTYSIGDRYACDPYSNTTSYTISSGLNNNTTYNWSVEAYYGYSGWIESFGGYGGSNQPYGSFTTPNCVPPPPTVDLFSWPTFEIPESIHLRWTSTNTDSCVASGDWSGNKPTQGDEYLSKPRGTYTFILTCTGPGGSYSDSVTVKVIQVPQCTFTANPTSIIPPASSTLSWSCQYTDACSIDQGIGSVNNVSGTKGVRSTKTTTYTLTCSGLDDSRSYQATVNIGFIPKLREVIPR